jgi:hypothetical protein
MIRIEVVSAQVHEKKGTANATGKPYCIREQDAYAYTVDRNGETEKHPQKIVIGLDRDEPGYQPGMYTLLPQSFYVKQDRFGATLAVGRLVLKAIAADSKLKAA